VVTAEVAAMVARIHGCSRDAPETVAAISIGSVGLVPIEEPAD
jgi:hypothetical protein